MMAFRRSRIGQKSPTGLKATPLRLRLEQLERRDLLAAFTPGNLVVYRVGDGSATLTSTATAVFLDEYTPGGTLVQSIAMPTSVSGSQLRLTASGTATSEGGITRSADGRFLLVTGYDANPGTASIASTNSATVARVVGVVDVAGNINTSTSTTSFSGNNIRSAISSNGTDIWMAGANTGVVYTQLGGSGAGTVVSSTNTNNRQINIFAGQLYASMQSGSNRLMSIDSGLPTGTGQTMTQLPGISTANPFQFFFADLSASVPGVDTVYVADDTGSTGVQKYSLVGGNWVLTGSAGGASSFRGVTGVVNGSTVTLYATRSSGSGANSQIYVINDTSGYNGTLTATPSVIASAAPNTAIRGIALVPEAVSTVYVNPGWSSPNNLFIADANPVTAGNQSAYFSNVATGGNAYSSINTAIAALGAAGGTVFVNAGTYNENITIPANVTLRLLGTDASTADTVTVLSIAGSGTIDTSSVGNLSNTLVVNGSTDTTFSGTITGSGSLVKQGSGTLTLTGSNSYSGSTTISVGTLRIGTGGSLGSGNVINDATLEFSSANALTIDNAISGSGDLIQSGSGTTTLTAVNTYTGTTFITDGVLSISANANLGNDTAGLVIAGGTLRATSTLELAAIRNVLLGPDTGTGSGTIDVANGVTLTYAGTLANNGTGSGGLVKLGQGTLELSGSGTYTETTTINGGILLNNATLTSAMDVVQGTLQGSGSSGAVTIASGAVFAPGAYTVNGDLDISGTLIIRFATPTSADQVTVLGEVTLSGELQVSYTGTPGTFNPTGGQISFVIDNDATDAVTGIFQGLPNSSELLIDDQPFRIFYSSGTGNDVVLVCFLPPSEVYVDDDWASVVSGTAIVDADPVTAGDQSVLFGYNAFATLGEALAALATTGGTLFVNAGTYSESVALPANITLRLLGSDSSTAAMITLNSLSGQGAIDTSSVGDLPNTVAVGDGTTTTYAGSLSGLGSLIKQGSGTLILTGTNSHATTTISEGTLQIGDGSTLGTLGLGAVNILANATLSVHRSDTVTLANELTGAGLFAQIGSGTTILTGSNTYGDTVISAGVLQVGDGGTSGTLGSGSVSNHGLLIFNRSDDLLISQNISGSGNLVKQNSNTVTLTGANTYLGTTTIEQGTLRIGNAGTSGTIGSGNVFNDGTLVFARSDALVVANSITGSGTLDQVGAGTLTLTGNSSYTGMTNVIAGTLLIDGSITGDVKVFADAVLGGTGSSGGVTVLSSGTLNPGNTTPGTFTVNGDLLLEAGSHLILDLTDSAKDLVTVTGTVTLAASNLTLQGSLTPTPGQTFLLIDQTGTQVVSGTFTGKPEGFRLTFAGQPYRLFYTGGTGNDVLLLSTPAVDTTYADPSWASLAPGTSLTDVDPVQAGDQPGVIGWNAFASVQGAIEAVSPHGTALLNAGTFAENVLVDKALSLLGNTFAPNIARLQPSGGTALSITSDGVTVRNLTISGADVALNAALSGAGSTLTLSDLTFTGNVSSGAISHVGTLNVTGTTGNVDDVFTLTAVGLQLQRQGVPAIPLLSLTNIGTLNLFGDGGSDRFHLTPLVDTFLFAHGGDPTTTPGDVLSVDLQGSTGVGLTTTQTGESLAGTWTFSNRSSVQFSGVESLTGPSLVITAPSSVRSGGFFSVQVRVTDANGATLTSYDGPVTLTLDNNAGPGTLSGITTVNAVNGVATFTGLSIDRAANGYTLRATTLGRYQTVSNAMNVTASGIRFLTVPSTVSSSVPGVGRPFVLQVEGFDATGQRADNFTEVVTLSVATGPGTLGGTLTVNAGNLLSSVGMTGTATFADLFLARAGNYTLQASSAGLTTVTTPTITVTATRLIAQLVGIANFNRPLTVRVTAIDASGAVAGNFQGNVQLILTASNGQQISVTGRAVNGRVTLTTRRLPFVGAYTLVAISTEIAPEETANDQGLPPAPIRSALGRFVVGRRGFRPL